MRLLFIVEACLRINTSANLCHLAYIQGAVDNDFEVDVISVSEQPDAIDKNIKLPKGVNWIYIDPPKYSRSFFSTTGNGNKDIIQNKENKNVISLTKVIKKLLKMFYGVYGRTPTLWVKKALKYKFVKHYDYVISLATPFISHRLGMLLIQKNLVSANNFIEIWEDPWTLSIFKEKNNILALKEEKKLVSVADKIIYVSPLTLKYQKELFPDYKDKMIWHPLPYYYKNDRDVKGLEPLFGYYGDYYSFCRNLRPFYEAAKQTGIKANIFGNSDENFQPTNNITVKPRVDLKTLNIAENKTTVYVFLCNLKGGQIPGKIYQNSASKKQILFILDGTKDEKKVLKDYFNQFNRYEFCDNTIDSIIEGINRIVSKKSKALCEPVEEFSPKKTIKEIINS